MRRAVAFLAWSELSVVLGLSVTYAAMRIVERCR